MTAAEAFAIVDQLGLTDRVKADVRAAPPLTPGQADLVRRLFAHPADDSTTTAES